MFRNIVLDAGGVLFNDSKENIDKFFHKDCEKIYKIAYGDGFRKCILGYKTIEEHIEDLKEFPEYEEMSFILKKENLFLTFPLMKENFEYVKTLKSN